MKVELGAEAKTKPEVSVIVPVLGYDNIKLFLDSLQFASCRTSEIIILDSTPYKERIEFRNFDPDKKSTIIHVIMDPPLSFHAIWNLGLRISTAPYIALMNDDIAWGHRSLDNCIEALRAFNLLAVYPKHTSSKPDTVMKTEELALWFETAKEISQKPISLEGPPEYRGFAWIMHRKVLDIVGYFDEQFGLYYGDNDYYYRLIDVRRPPRCVTNAVIHHFVSQTTKACQKRGDDRDFLQIRKDDMVRFRKKWGKLTAKDRMKALGITQG
jgi:GT2 family glycosyltransferase